MPPLLMVCLITGSILTKPRIKEIHSVFIDNLEEWIDVPVYDESDLSKINVDWDGLTMVEYKKLLIDHIDLEPRIKSQINSYIIRDEIYEQIIRKNPGLAPKLASVSGQPYYTEQESSLVMDWFASHAIRGKKPEVIINEGER